MRPWLSKGMGDGILIGLLHVTPRPHLRVIRLLWGNPFKTCVGRKSKLVAGIIATAAETCPQSYFRFALLTSVSYR